MKESQQVTMADIARLASVSVPTVSYILNGRARERHLSASTVQRVTEAARELGYIRNGIASNLRRRRTNSVAMLVSDLERGWANRVMLGALEVLDKRGLNLSLTVHFWDPDRERRELEVALQEKKAGIIARPLAENAEIYQMIVDRGTPLVLLDDIVDLSNCSTVMWDPADSIGEAIRRFEASGRDRIGYLGVDRGTGEEAERLAAFKSAMANIGLPLDPHWICIDRRYALQNVGPRGGRVAGYGNSLKEMITSGKRLPNAIIASADALAWMAITILREDFGIRVPEDMAVFGLGDNGESSLLGLSAAPEPLEEIGKSAGEVLLCLLDEGPGMHIRKRIPTQQVHFRRTTPQTEVERIQNA